jgi:hypothetical protein
MRVCACMEVGQASVGTGLLYPCPRNGGHFDVQVRCKEARRHMRVCTCLEAAHLPLLELY